MDARLKKVMSLVYSMMDYCWIVDYKNEVYYVLKDDSGNILETYAARTPNGDRIGYPFDYTQMIDFLKATVYPQAENMQICPQGIFRWAIEILDLPIDSSSNQMNYAAHKTEIVDIKKHSYKIGKCFSIIYAGYGEISKTLVVWDKPDQYQFWY